MKICTRCNQMKSLSDFSRKSQNNDGYRYACKDCSNKYQRNWNFKNKDKISVTNKKYSEKNKDKRQAINAARKVLSFQGDRCYFCESKNGLHKHHEDYLKPLEIVILCYKCHRRLHVMKDYFEVRYA